MPELEVEHSAGSGEPRESGCSEEAAGGSAWRSGRDFDNFEMSLAWFFRTQLKAQEVETLKPPNPETSKALNPLAWEAEQRKRERSLFAGLRGVCRDLSIALLGGAEDVQKPGRLAAVAMQSA